MWSIFKKKEDVILDYYSYYELTDLDAQGIATFTQKWQTTPAGTSTLTGVSGGDIIYAVLGSQNTGEVYLEGDFRIDFLQGVQLPS